jgi:DNA adenine methylase
MSRYPALRYHGSKFKLARWIQSLAPSAGSYTHRLIPFAGGLGELLGCADWPIDGISETVNDLNYELSTFWAVMGSPSLFPLFEQRCMMTPFSEEIFNSAEAFNQVYGTGKLSLAANDFVGVAHRFYCLQRMARQGSPRNGFATPTTRLRRGMNEQVSAWLASVEQLAEIHARLIRVEVRCMDAIDFNKRYDHDRAFFYCDPPYLEETRVSTGEYGKHEMTPADHTTLLECLARIKGKFLLSGYPSELYAASADDHGWYTADKLVDTPSSGSKIKPLRREYAWSNYPTYT